MLDSLMRRLRKDANPKDPEAQFNLGLSYLNGDGVVQDYQQAAQWFRKAAEQGYAFAQNNLGQAYRSGQGVAQDYQQAAQWFRKAAEQGFAIAQCNLGLCYTRGRGVEQDYQQAAQWYRKAAEQGEVRAQFLLGNSYACGQGVEQDFQKAVKWCRKAAEQGYAIAQYYLGRHYEYGDGVAQDYQQAADWYCKAAEQGMTDAQDALRDLSSKVPSAAQKTPTQPQSQSTPSSPSTPQKTPTPAPKTPSSSTTQTPMPPQSKPKQSAPSTPQKIATPIVNIPFDLRYLPDLTFYSHEKMAMVFPDTVGSGLMLISPSPSCNFAEIGLIIDNYLVQFDISGYMHILDIVKDEYRTLDLSTIDKYDRPFREWVMQISSGVPALDRIIRNDQRAYKYLIAYTQLMYHHTYRRLGQDEYNMCLSIIQAAFGIPRNGDILEIKNREWYHNGHKLTWGQLANNLFRDEKLQIFDSHSL